MMAQYPSDYRHGEAYRMAPGGARKEIGVTEVLIPATWWDPRAGTQRNEVAKFALGPGPCGKNVVRLEVHQDEGAWKVVQTCSDGAQRSFYYASHQITGRVEVETAAVEMVDVWPR